ncbi:hypothetical protein MKK68_02145 [Methylobacterium sp. E-016]|uniref:hypothetical protein n=1 Tax=Methylobacterium sp. E-016 TaxID=2836556 RepID=UPI001FBA4F58|nr:hypothetical protein [Methylobacterium sp. E-016]MCJ2074462.1 hypothetical protein [Methylobacterium sp. E-016]
MAARRSLGAAWATVARLRDPHEALGRLKISLSTELPGLGPESADTSLEQLDALARGERSRVVDPERAVLVIAASWAVGIHDEPGRRINLKLDDGGGTSVSSVTDLEPVPLVELGDGWTTAASG